MRRGGGGQLGVVADRVVVGDREEVEALPDREPGQLGHGHGAVRVHGVRMQVTRQPAPSGPAGSSRRGGRSASGGSGSGGGGGASSPGVLLTCAGQPVLGPAGRHPVQADHHLPGSRLEIAGQVAGRRRVRGDHERPAGPAGPAAEPAGRRGSPGQGRLRTARTPVPRAARTPRPGPRPAGTASGEAKRSSRVHRPLCRVMTMRPSDQMRFRESGNRVG